LKLREKATSEKKRSPKTHPYPVILYFKKVEDASNILTPLILSDADFKIASHKGFKSVFRGKQEIHAAFLKRSVA